MRDNAFKVTEGREETGKRTRVARSPAFESTCPMCNGEGFVPVEERPAGSWVSFSCSDCGLTCDVRVGPDSPLLEVSMHEWVAFFPND